MSRGTVIVIVSISLISESLGLQCYSCMHMDDHPLRNYGCERENPPAQFLIDCNPSNVEVIKKPNGTDGSAQNSTIEILCSTRLGLSQGKQFIVRECVGFPNAQEMAGKCFAIDPDIQYTEPTWNFTLDHNKFCFCNTDGCNSGIEYRSGLISVDNNTNNSASTTENLINLIETTTTPKPLECFTCAHLDDNAKHRNVACDLPIPPQKFLKPCTEDTATLLRNPQALDPNSGIKERLIPQMFCGIRTGDANGKRYLVRECIASLLSEFPFDNKCVIPQPEMTYADNFFNMSLTHNKFCFCDSTACNVGLDMKPIPPTTTTAAPVVYEYVHFNMWPMTITPPSNLYSNMTTMSPNMTMDTTTTPSPPSPPKPTKKSGSSSKSSSLIPYLMLGSTLVIIIFELSG